VFTVDDRDRVRDRILEMASSDPRVVAGAVLGSLAHGEGDRWSDLDLTFAVADGVSVVDVLEAWSSTVVDQFDAVRLFDLPSGPIIYRVFLLPGCLQFDLSFTPASEFRPGGPKFRLLFGSTVAQTDTGAPQAAEELFGYAVHHAVRARFCIERDRPWQAEYWISATRDHALALACRRHGLDEDYGRGFDQLPADLLEPFGGALVRSTEPDELRRALANAIAGLLRESDEAPELAKKVKGQLDELAFG
jgi:predicted nucleotidyltransferase